MTKRLAFCLAAFAAICLANSARAQSTPWVVFLDDQSESACDVVNVSNAELVVLAGTGELVVVTGPDLILDATFVDEAGFVFFDGFPVGVIDFATDGDGFRTLWWTGLDGSVVEIDPFTGEPFSSEFAPDDFGDVPCDACELWDDPADCDGGAIFDEDLDGVEDEFDFCEGTPIDEIADDFGCSCSQLDSDDDGIDDCFDDCLDTPLGEDVDFDGCSCFDFDGDDDGVEDCFDECPNTPIFDEVNLDGCSIDDDGGVIVEPGPIFISCGNFTSLTMMTMLAGLCSLRFRRSRMGSEKESWI